MKKLTEKQEKLLAYIKVYILTNNYSPTVREMMDNFGWKSESSVTRKLDSMEAKGKITRVRGRFRNVLICA